MSDTLKYEIGDPVWTKMRGFCHWPSRIAAPEESALKNTPLEKNRNKAHYLVYFFGSNNFAWMMEDTIKPYDDPAKEKMKKGSKNVQFRQGLKQIEEYIAEGGKATLVDNPLISGAAIRNNNNDVAAAASPSVGGDSPENDASNLDGDLPSIEEEIAVIHNSKPASAARRSKNSHDSHNDSSSLTSPAPSSGTKDYSRTPFKSRKTAKSDDPDTETTSPTKRIKTSDDDKFGISSISGSTISTTVSSAPKSQPASRAGARNVILRGIKYADSPIETPNINMTSVLPKAKSIRPSTLKFGFIGLGLMGQRLLKNLLDSGHKVTIWNRSTDKCDAFVEVGASAAKTPADVLEASDIVFSCVSDPNACKEVVFGTFGILQAMKGAHASKGYVEMSSIDPETSNDISEAIISRGGFYLEAPMIAHGKQAAESGEVIIVVAGDKKLYEDCTSCFQAMGKRSIFLGHEVGRATKLNLIFAMLYGAMMAALGECCSLIERTEAIQMSQFKEILNLSIMKCPLLDSKLEKITKNDTTSVEFPLDLLQKDLRLALNLTESCDQSCPVAAITNEVFKATKKCGYRNHDVSAVYLKQRF